MKYLNVKRDNTYVLSEDKKYSRKELIKFVSEEIKKANVKLNALTFNKDQFLLNFALNGHELIFDIFLKNITGAGWEDKPYIKRCQVSNLKNVDPEKTKIIPNGHYNLILGYYNFDANPILVAWDPYRYFNHKTVRSCYVTVDALKRGYERGYYDCVVSSQKCWIFVGEQFSSFIEQYMDYISNVYLRGEE